MYEGSLWNHLDKKVLLRHREACIFPNTSGRGMFYPCIVFMAHVCQQMFTVIPFKTCFGLDVLIQTKLKCAAHWMTDSNPGAESRCAINRFKPFRCSFTREPPTNTGVRVQRDEYTSDSLGLQ